MVGYAGAERIVLGSLLGGLSGALFGLVGAATRLFARLARCRRGGSNRSRGDATPARRLRQLLELVGRLIDRLKMAFVFVAAAWGRHVRVPALGHVAPRELNLALVERSLQLE
jgi:dihydrodipicolinate synthase/N-acetylneuraminate lyase